jgi:uncharacterized membrane protein YjjP (DUF1212 family)
MSEQPVRPRQRRLIVVFAVLLVAGLLVMLRGSGVWADVVGPGLAGGSLAALAMTLLRSRQQ